jgi:hypothetical protein
VPCLRSSRRSAMSTTPLLEQIRACLIAEAVSSLSAQQALQLTLPVSNLVMIPSRKLSNGLQRSTVLLSKFSMREIAPSKVLDNVYPFLALKIFRAASGRFSGTGEL